METSNSIAVLPPKPALLARPSTFDWTQFYEMLPHAEIGLSKASHARYNIYMCLMIY